MLESIAIIVIFNLIRIIWCCHKENRAFVAQHGTQEECRQAADLAAAMQRKMEALGLGNYLRNDFRFTEQLTPADLKSETLLQQKMTCMMRELHTYLRLCPGYTLHVRFDRDHSMDRAGQFDCVNRRIDIFPRGSYSAEYLVTVLAHETAHCFMYQYGLNDPDRDLNERCTDTIACLMGLSSYMVAGGNGYLKHGQFVAVRNSLLNYRDNYA